MLFIAAAFVLEFQMYAQLMIVLITLCLADVQLEERAFLRLCEIGRQDRIVEFPYKYYL